jgi:hypothetical protein
MKKNKVEDENLLGHLEDLANSLNIEVRYEQLKKEGAFFPGGLCKVKGEDIIIINSNAAIEDKIVTLSKALSTFDLSQIYIRPALREFLSNHSFD